MSNSTALLADLTAFCQSDSLSEDGLQEIIERHGWEPNHPTISYGFFHLACRNERVTEGILRYLLRNFPGAGTFIDEERQSPLTHICHNNNVTLGIVRLLLDAFPDSVRNQDVYDGLPLSCFCCFTKNLDNEVAVDILKLLIERYPESVRNAVYDGSLPIHIAAGMKSPDFCRVLVAAYPGSERLATAIEEELVNRRLALGVDPQLDTVGALPFHCACEHNAVATAQYLLELYPEGINVATNDGSYPIHKAMLGVRRRTNPATAIDMVQYLLDYNASVVLQQKDDKPLLYWACNFSRKEIANTAKMDAYLKILQLLYDVHPEAMEHVSVTSNLDRFPQEVQAFIVSQLHYAFLAREHPVLTTPDENEQLPLHVALRDNVTFGSIKLLVKGNPSAVSVPDNRGMMPLHIACKHHESASVVQYLLDLDPTSLQSRDVDDNTALHHACCGAKYDTIALLLEKYSVVSVSNPNSSKLLPIDLLLGSKAVSDRESIAYTESIFRLLKVYPQAAINYMPDTMTHQAASKEVHKSKNAKKRTFDSV